MSKPCAATPITVAGMPLIPIERVRIHRGMQPCAHWLEASKEAVAVVICEPEGPRAVDVGAQERPIGELIAEISELESVLTEFFPTRCGSEKK